MLRLLTIIAAAGVSACSTNEVQNAGMAYSGDLPVRGEDPGYPCRKPGDRDFIGQLASAELGGRMLAQSRARTLRWVPFGAMITMDFNPNRLTVRLDQQNRVASMTCG